MTYDMGRLERALRKAHEAGDTESARVLAGQIRQMRAEKPSRTQALGRGAAQGFSVGTADEMVAGAQAGHVGLGNLGQAIQQFREEHGRMPTPEEVQAMPAGLKADRDQRYDEALGEYRGKDEAARREHPVSFGAGEITGAVGSAAVPGGAVVRGTKGLGLARQIGAGAAAGGLHGGVYGFNSGEGGVEDRLDSSGIGAISGAAFGSLAPVAGPVAGAGWRGLRRVGRGVMGRGPSVPGLSDKTLRSAARSFARDAGPLDDVAQNAQRLGPQGMVADVSPSLRGKGDQLIAADPAGGGRQALIDALVRRSDGAGQRIDDAWDDAFGPHVNSADIIDALRADRSAKAKPLYERAYQDAMRPSNEIADMLGTDFGQIAMRRAQRFANAEGRTIDPGRLDIYGADQLKRAFDDMIEAAKRKGDGNLSRILSGMRSKLVQEADSASPTFAQARAVSQEGFALEDALGMGQDVLRRGNPDLYARQVSQMTPDEQILLRQGMRSAVDDARGEVLNPELAGRKMLNRPNTRQRVAAGIGDEPTEELARRLDAETTFAQTQNEMMGNSRTAFRSLGNEFAERNGEKGFASSLDQMAGDAVKGVWNTLARPFRADMSNEYARLLTATGKERDEIIRALTARALVERADGSKGKNIDLLVRALMQGGGATVPGYAGG